MDKIARNSFSTVTEQVKASLGIEKPKETNYGLFLGLAAVVSVVLCFYWRKK
ncbi:hypothetical protein [Tolypothrix sp. PCC 7601]|uniref:hypothetical protein n=2 Tax=Tolypothrix TaxID=111782 RepID=UPI0021DFC281|nr:hypothetical protein [Tolypothrix sp. PCC 7601]